MIVRKLNIITICLIILSFTLIEFLPAQTVKTVTKTGTGVYLLPSNVETLTVECWGGGGTGGSCMANRLAKVLDAHLQYISKEK